MRRLVLAVAALSITALAAPVTAQSAPPQGLTPLQMMRLRTVVEVLPSANGEKVAFVRREPRLAGDEPGPARMHLYLLEIDGAEVSERLLIGGKESVRGAAWEPGTDRITFVDKRAGDPHAEVWALALDGGEPTKVTTTTHGIDSYEWRPDGGALAYTVADPLSPARAAAAAAGFRPQIVDEDFRHLSLWLWDRASGESRRLTEGKTVLHFRWAPDGQRLAAGIAPRNSVDDGYVFTKLYVVEPESGAVELLVDNPGKLGDYAWSPTGEHLAWVGAADRNDPHAGMLYLADRRTHASRALTPGLLGMVHGVRWETAYKGYPGREVITAVVSRGVQVRDMVIAPETDQPKSHEFASPAGAPVYFKTHGSWPDAGGRYLVGSTPSHPDEVFGRGFGPGLRRLTDSNPWLKDTALGQQEVVRFTARDGVEIEGLLLHPVGGPREGTRAPLVIVAHGGPEAHFSNGWNSSYAQWGQLLSARGYFVWMPNYRSSTGYGVAFAKADHGDPMGKEFLDHLDAIDHLAQRGLIDPQRVGIGGGSYGGYTAAWAATRHTEHFAAAVSFVPFVDIRTKWLTTDVPYEFYHVHYQEKWPHEQPGMLADRSPLTHAAQCRTPLLLLGGTADARVHPSQPFMLYRAIKHATDTPVRYVQYPGEGHGNRTNVYQYDYALRTLGWFEHYLRPGDHRRDAPPPFEIDYDGWHAPAGNGGR